MPYTWITEPPVEETRNWDELQGLCTQVITEADRPQMDEVKAWEQRKSWAKDSANYLRAWAGNEAVRNPKIWCVYKHSGKMVGLMMWSPGPRQGNVYFTMLPGYESECTILVEYAVNLSEKAGYEGRVLLPLVANGQFESPWPGSRNIVPSESDEWVKLEGTWRRLFQVKAANG